ncbi:MGMT family protein [Aeromicrobium sp. CF3.5]|uniref:MGMT family protein n=1 Tax=Aeromicrobium sp. CF3.5 TaxID=3373078 RepID=UPI003EE6379E
MDEEFVERVLALVESIPVGRVLSYGRIAEHVAAGYGPRYVGRVMSLEGSAVTWWRVVRADGTIAGPLMAEAQMHWLEESTPVRRGRVHMAEALWEPRTG